MMNDNIECYHPYVKHQMDLYNDNVITGWKSPYGTTPCPWGL